MTLFKRMTPGALLMLTAACGGFSEDPGKPNVLATLHGEVVNPDPNSVSPPPNLGVALVWHGSTYGVAEELRVVPEFPARFALEIDQLPPAETMYTNADQEFIPPGARFAYGAVVGYEDMNQNGRLDMVDIGAESFVDQLVATNENLVVVYAEGSDEALAGFEQTVGFRPSRGFGLMELITNESTVETRYLPITEQYPLPLAANPRLNSLMCTPSGDTDSSGTGRGPDHSERPAVYPAPGDPNITCAADGGFYSTSVCVTTELGPCRGTTTQCTRERWLRPDPIPSDWPCQ